MLNKPAPKLERIAELARVFVGGQHSYASSSARNWLTLPLISLLSADAYRRTVCDNSTSTDLWGERRVIAASTWKGNLNASGSFENSLNRLKILVSSSYWPLGLNPLTGSRYTY